LALTFDEIIEVVLGQPLIQSHVEWLTYSRSRTQGEHDHIIAIVARMTQV
jgi:hypothetical protein